MRFLGIDYGTKRVGLAISNDTNTFALPVAVLANDKNLVPMVKKFVTDRAVGTIVLGESKDFSGEDNPVMKDIRTFKKILEKEVGVLVEFEPEFMTSAEADRMHEQKPQQSRRSGIRLRRPKVPNDMLDASAAALILQSYLDRIKN